MRNQLIKYIFSLGSLISVCSIPLIVSSCSAPKIIGNFIISNISSYDYSFQYANPNSNETQKPLELTLQLNDGNENVPINIDNLLIFKDGNNLKINNFYLVSFYNIQVYQIDPYTLKVILLLPTDKNTGTYSFGYNYNGHIIKSDKQININVNKLESTLINKNNKLSIELSDNNLFIKNPTQEYGLYKNSDAPVKFDYYSIWLKNNEIMSVTDDISLDKNIVIENPNINAKYEHYLVIFSFFYEKGNLVIKAK